MTSQDLFWLFAGRYATRSLWRNRRRTLLIIGTVALSVAVSIVGQRYSRAILKIWEDGAINHGTGHAQIHTTAYREHPDILSEATSFREGHPIEQQLQQDPAVAGFSRRLLLEGIISSAGKSIYFLGRAIDAEAELIVSPDIFHAGADQGSFVSQSTGNGVVIGQGLASTLGLKIGDEATILSHTLAGGVNGTDVRVIGITDPPIPSLSKRLLYMNIEAGQRILQMPGRYNELAIRLRDGAKVEKWVATTEAGTGLELRGWWQIDPIIKNVERIWNSILGVICFLLFVSAGISVLNIVYMLVSERTVEIGTLMAIGAKPRDIRLLFTLEACTIGLLGGLLGALIGNAVVFVMDLTGVPFDSPFGSGILMVHPKMHLWVTLVIELAAVVICYLSALAPSRKAAGVQPVTAFRGQMT